MNEKRCITCNMLKPLSEYYKHAGMTDGHLNKCKSCVREYVRKGTIAKTCLECSSEFMTKPSEVRRGGGKVCSRACYYKRLPKLLEAKNCNKKMAYGSIHAWVKRKLGKPNYCEACKTSNEKKSYDWSNISGEYKRDIKDWQRLCRKCHIDYDIRHNNKSEKWRQSMNIGNKDNTL